MSSAGTLSFSAPYRAMFGASPLPMWIHSGNGGGFLVVNDATVSGYGYTRTQLLEMTIRDIAADEESAARLLRVTPPNIFVDGGLHRTRSGHLIAVEITVQKLLLDGREVFVVVACDVTERREQEERLRRSEKTISEMLERISDAFVALDSEWRYTYANEAAARIFGRDRRQLIGKHIWTEFPEGIGQPFHLAYEEAMKTQQFRKIEAYYAPWDRWFENRIYPSPDGITIYFHDVTERREVDEELRQFALKDAVTGAANRLLFCDRLGLSIAHAHRHDCDVGVLLLDVDGFRSVNERYGIVVADRLLRQVAERLLGCVRECDTVARVGSDEFGIVLQDIPSRDGAVRVAEKIQHVFADAFDGGPVEMHLTASIGLAVYPRDGHDVDMLLQSAETALQAARLKGAGQIVIFEE